MGGIDRRPRRRRHRRNGSGFERVGPDDERTRLPANDGPAGRVPAATRGGAPTPFVVAQVDRKACTQTSKPVAGQTGASLVAFSPPGAPTTTSGLLEYVLTFPTAKAATTAYKALAGDAAARLKCKTVDYIPADKTAPTVPSTYAKVKVPKVGEGTVATSGSTSTTKGSILVTFVDGTHVVGLSFAGEPYAPNANDLATITKNADTRLAELG